MQEFTCEGCGVKVVELIATGPPERLWCSECDFRQSLDEADRARFDEFIKARDAAPPKPEQESYTPQVAKNARKVMRGIEDDMIALEALPALWVGYHQVDGEVRMIVLPCGPIAEVEILAEVLAEAAARVKGEEFDVVAKLLEKMRRPKTGR